MRKSFIFFICAFAILLPAQGFSQNHKNRNYINPDAGYEPIFMPKLVSTSVFVDDDVHQPVEPNFVKIKFRKIPPFNGLDNRVDFLIQGITKKIPAEFDHYGYEIRRYMSAVGNLKIYTDEDFLIEQIKGARKARVIFDYWEEHINNEIKEIEKELQKNKQIISLSARSNLRQNKAHLKTFMIVLKSWIDANERLLMFIFDNPGIFDISYPEIIITDGKNRVDYYNLLAFKQAKLKELQTFIPFEMMVY